MAVQRVRVVDSHTAGEPTRVVVEGGPELGGGSAADQLEVLRARFDQFRAGVVGEPRGSEALVGALLVPPADPRCAAGVIFFNNVGYLGMCGHGTIGVMATLKHLGRIGPGEVGLETPVGIVRARLHPDGRVTVRNVPSRRHLAGVTVEVDGHGPVAGDVAWGGNWFFLTDGHGQDLLPARIPRLLEFARRVRRALERDGVRGAGGAAVDHVALFGPGGPGAHARSFVLCPGGAYDRSPCGTGTSAKLACLAADGRLGPGEVWVQEGIHGGRFETWYELEGDQVVPHITGRAFLTAEAVLLFDDRDPHRWGLPRPDVFPAEPS
jgi:4-hydroxyproline epimerase